VPTPTTTKDRPLCPEGEFIFKLVEVAEKDVKSQFAKTPGGTIPKWIWRFEAVDEVDENDDPFEVTIFTGTSFGDKRAALTVLLRSIFGKEYTEEDALKLDTDDLIGKRFRCTILHKENDDGRVFANVAKISMIQRKAKPKVDDDDFGD
jgi:hypothetical protein